MAKGGSSLSSSPSSSSSSMGKVGSSSSSEWQRKRLKKLALSNEMLSEKKATNFNPLSLSKTIIKHGGKDIVKKHANKKNRFLFSFPGFLSPLNATGSATIGHFHDLSTQNPILYLDFPQGRMKLFGTIVYPNNRYQTLQFKGAKNVLVDDFFDNMVVFSDVWWIGRKEDNPQEAKLDFPKELMEGQYEDCDFRGGAGAAPLDKQAGPKTGMKYDDQLCLDTEFDDALTDGEQDSQVKMEVTPTRHSERNTGKKFKFAEFSSEDDPDDSEADKSEGQETKVGLKVFCSTGNNTAGKTSNSCSIVLDFADEDAADRKHSSKEFQMSMKKATKSKKLSDSSISETKEGSKSQHGSLVQATISTLFKKVEEKKATGSSRKSASLKVSRENLRQSELKKKIDQAEGSGRKEKVTRGKNNGPEAKKEECEVEDDDDIEEFSGSSQDSDGSDEDWAA